MSEKFLYLTTTGRVTGHPHHIEIWYVDYENCFYLCSGGREKADWVQNIQHKPDVRFYIAERDTPSAPNPATANIPDQNSALVQQIKTLFKQKYDWNDGLIIEICPTSD